MIEPYSFLSFYFFIFTLVLIAASGSIAPYCRVVNRLLYPKRRRLRDSSLNNPEPKFKTVNCDG